MTPEDRRVTYAKAKREEIAGHIQGHADSSERPEHRKQRVEQQVMRLGGSSAREENVSLNGRVYEKLCC